MHANELVIASVGDGLRFLELWQAYVLALRGRVMAELAQFNARPSPALVLVALSRDV